MPISIWAPHGDDEIIGCWSLLRGVEPVDVYFSSPIEEGMLRSGRGFKFRIHELPTLARQWDVVYAPDPETDDHPLHQEVGNHAIQLWRHGRINRLLFYTTSMRARYISALPEGGRLKLGALEDCYPEKSNLWRYEHKYFLFEGYTEWHRPAL